MFRVVDECLIKKYALEVLTMKITITVDKAELYSTMGLESKEVYQHLYVKFQRYCSSVDETDPKMFQEIDELLYFLSH